MTPNSGAPESEMPETYDQIARDLQAVRLEAGAPSYAEIARRIAEHRATTGIVPAAQVPARTTVYDVFRTGRLRMNAELVGEIARALHQDESQIVQWMERCHRARRAVAEGRVPAPTQTPTPMPAPAPAPEGADRPSHHVGLRWWRGSPIAARILFALVCVGINFGGYAAVEFFDLSLYLDTIGTGLCAIVLGPWYGVLVGVSTNLLGYTIHGSMALPFALQSAALALVWGYGARRFRLTLTLGRYFTLNVCAGFSHVVVAAPLLLLLFPDGTGHAGDALTHTIVSLGAPVGVSVYAANTTLALADSLLAGFIILLLIGMIRTKPPFAGLCPQFFPFSIPHDISHIASRTVTCTIARARTVRGAWTTRVADGRA